MKNIKKRMTDRSRQIINRLSRSVGAKTQSALAEFLRVRQGNISQAIKNNHVPDTWLYKVSYHTGRTVEWLRSGTGPEFADAAHETERRYGLIEAEALRIFLTRRLDLKQDQQHLIDHALRLLMETDDETRELMVVLLKKIANQPATPRQQRASAPQKKSAGSA